MNTKPDGGPAFPHTEYSEHSEQARAMNWQASGMTLRDYFAAKAICGMLADHNVKLNDENMVRHTAELAYEVADAMIAARGEA
jgi:hypothetical protein